MSLGELLSHRLMITSEEIRELFSPEYINELAHESQSKTVKELESVKQQNIEKLNKLEHELTTVQSNIQILLKWLTESDSDAAQIENAKQAVNESMKFASIFAQEKEYDTHRGTRYLAIKEHYQKHIYPAYNEALLQANQFLKQAEERQIDQLYAILKVVLSDENIKRFWCRQVGGKTSVIDGSKINDLPVPRGVYKAWIELNKLNEDGSNKREAVKLACLRMQERLGENDNEKPTTALYLAIDNLLNDKKLVLTEDKLLYLIEVLENEMFESVSKSIEKLEFSTKPSKPKLV